MATTETKEEEFLAPSIPIRKNSQIPHSQSDIIVSQNNNNKNNLNISKKKRRASTGSHQYPVLHKTPRTISKRVNSMFSEILNGTLNTPEIRKNKLSKGLNDVVIRNETEALQTLIEQGANPNGNPNAPCVPLYVAVDLQNEKACEILLNSGASMVQQSKKRKQTPLELALSERRSVYPIFEKKLRRMEVVYQKHLTTHDILGDNNEDDDSDEDYEPPKKKQKIL